MRFQKTYIASAVCLFAGLIVFFVGFAMMGFNIMNFDTEPAYTSATYEADGNIPGIVIDDENADIKLAVSKDDKVHIKYYENSKRSYEFSTLPDGALSITATFNTDWTQSIGISVSTPTLTVMLPEGYKGEIKADCDFGDISAEDISADALTAESENGTVRLSGTKIASNLTVNTDYGNIELYNISVGRTAKLTADSGNLFAQILTAADIYAESDDGHITLADIQSTGSIFGEGDSGDIQISNIAVGSSMTLITDNGDIRGNIKGAVSDFTYNCSAQNGECNLPESLLGGEKQLNLKADNGDIEIYMITESVAQ